MSSTSTPRHDKKVEVTLIYLSRQEVENLCQRTLSSMFCNVMKELAVYNSISKEYGDLVLHDPSKRFVQYPWAISQVPQPPLGLHILDVGCGEGSLPRLLAQKGALVCGYDNSAALIEQAVKAETVTPLGIKYIIADPTVIWVKCPTKRFDIALSTAVLHYARDTDHLASFFSSTYQLLKPGGVFAALVCNPEFKRYNHFIYNRVYAREPNGHLRVDFYDADKKCCSAYYSDFATIDYEKAAQTCNWQSLTWCPIKVTQEGKNLMGSFWDGFEEDCPYIGIRCSKPG